MRSARPGRATRCWSYPAARGSRTPCAPTRVASPCGRRPLHRMAILAMDQFGWLLSDLIPDALPCTQLASARDAAGRGQTPVLLAAAMLASDPLPVSAAVTSDSIAAWVAGVVGAARVVLVKPVAGLYRDWPPDGPPPARLSVGELAGLRAAGRAAGVDAYLPAGAARGRRRGVGDRWPRPGAAGDAARARQRRRDARDLGRARAQRAQPLDALRVEGRGAPAVVAGGRAHARDVRSRRPHRG